MHDNHFYFFRKLKIVFLFIGICFYSFAQAENESPEVGRHAAEKFFTKPKPSDNSEPKKPMDHYLAIHANLFMSSQSWAWGSKNTNNPGNYGLGVTYRLSDWQEKLDMNLRFEFIEYDVAGNRPLKFSIMPLITFPDANSQFPLYFGVGLGPGIFFRQVDGESSLALDYTMVVGARFFDVEGHMGFFVESGLKNHLLITSDGQFNGVFLGSGALFTF